MPASARSAGCGAGGGAPHARSAPSLRLLPERRQHGQLQRRRQRLHRGGAAHQSHRQHARAAHGVDHRPHLIELRVPAECGQVDTHSGALEEKRRAGHTAGQLVENRARIGRADAHLHEADLPET